MGALVQPYTHHAVQLSLIGGCEGRSGGGRWVGRERMKGMAIRTEGSKFVRVRACMAFIGLGEGGL